VKKKTTVKNERYEEHFNKQRSVEYPYPTPYEYNMDTLAVMSDEEVAERFNMLDAQRLELIKKRFSPVLWEIELSYLMREYQIRRIRRQKHQEYVGQLTAEMRTFRDSEYDLPEYSPTAPLLEEMN
jgi:hypothetical protein